MQTFSRRIYRSLAEPDSQIVFVHYRDEVNDKAVTNYESSLFDWMKSALNYEPRLKNDKLSSAADVKLESTRGHITVVEDKLNSLQQLPLSEANLLDFISSDTMEIQVVIFNFNLFCQFY